MCSFILENRSLVGSQYVNGIIELIDNAEWNIEIIMFDWRWYKEDPSVPMSLINQSLVRAVRRGVNVSAYTSNLNIVKILNSLGIKARQHKGRSLLHVKQVTIDSFIIVTGSHNFTNSAMRSNIESSIVVYDEIMTKRGRDLFNTLWSSSQV